MSLSSLIREAAVAKLGTGGGGGGGAVGSGSTTFNQAIPLTFDGTTFMDTKTVNGPLTFTAAAGAVRGALVYLRLIADGANVPNFSAFKEWGGSMGYDNRAGIANQIQFFYDGVDLFYTASQAVGATGAPAVASGVTMTGPTGGVVSTASSNFTLGVSPVGGTITGTVVVTPSDGGAGGTFSPTSASLTSAAPSATFTYTPASTGAKTISVTNNGGLSNPANITYTVTAAATAPGAPTIGTAAAGDGYVDVYFTAPASNGGSAILDYTATLSTGETATGTSSPIRLTAGNGVSRTGNVKARNAINTGPASAESNSVTPTAAAPGSDIRLASVTNMTESASAPWVYTAAVTVWTNPVGGMAPTGLQSGTDGYFQQSLTNASTGEYMLGITTSATPVVFGSLDYCFYAKSTGTYAAFTAGVTKTVVNVTRVSGDLMRLRRAGTTLYAEVARLADPTTWIEVCNWTGVPTGAYKFQATAKGAGSISNFVASGLA